MNKNKEFIKKARLVHGNKYDYSKVNYVGCMEKVEIVCPIHGSFFKSPAKHLHGQGCQLCSKENTKRGILKYTLSDFIRKAREKHGDKYDYSKVEYKSWRKDDVCIVCPIHGEFWQKPDFHIHSKGCPKCAHGVLTTEEFIERANVVHNHKYDYRRTVYDFGTHDVEIVCPIHGSFWQLPVNHLSGNGCPVCARLKYDLENFIKKSKEIHGDKYDYSKVEYVDTKTKVCIICPEHGEFWQTPQGHFKQGCFMCGREQGSVTRTTSKDNFIKKAKNVHGDVYDYTNIEYVNMNTKIKIICPKHGEFEQLPTAHVRGQGCPKCGYVSSSFKNTKTTEQFIEDAKKVHGDKYDYSKVEYIKHIFPIKIICPEHGEFLQTPNEHLTGSGCPKCTLKSQNRLLKKLKIVFPHESFTWEYTSEWLDRQRIDICLEKYCIGIEYDGQQHYFPVAIFGGEEKFKEQVESDALKNQKCKENGFTLFRVKYDYSDEDFYDLCVNIKEIINSKNVNDE